LSSPSLANDLGCSGLTLAFDRVTQPRGTPLGGSRMAIHVASSFCTSPARSNSCITERRNRGCQARFRAKVRTQGSKPIWLGQSLPLSLVLYWKLNLMKSSFLSEDSIHPKFRGVRSAVAHLSRECLGLANSPFCLVGCVRHIYACQEEDRVGLDARRNVKARPPFGNLGSSCGCILTLPQIGWPTSGNGKYHCFDSRVMQRSLAST
jgi:hypothetical protein